MDEAEKALGTVRLLSVGDAAALINFLHAGLEEFGEFVGWEIAAMSNASKFLNRVTAIA
jgi:hypothetical protein